MWHVRVHKCLEPLCSATQCKCKPPLLKFGFEDVKQWWTLSPQSNQCFQHQIAWLCQSALPLNANCARERKANQGSSKIESTLQYRLNLSNQFHLWKTISTIPIPITSITSSHRNCQIKRRFIQTILQSLTMTLHQLPLDLNSGEFVHWSAS